MLSVRYLYRAVQVEKRIHVLPPGEGGLLVCRWHRIAAVQQMEHNCLDSTHVQLSTICHTRRTKKRGNGLDGGMTASNFNPDAKLHQAAEESQSSSYLKVEV